MREPVLCVVPNGHPMLVPPSPMTHYVLTRDLRRLTADLKATNNKMAVVRRYKAALVTKVEVRYDFRTNFDSVVLMRPEVCASVREARKNGERG